LDVRAAAGEASSLMIHVLFQGRQRWARHFEGFPSPDRRDTGRESMRRSSPGYPAPCSSPRLTIQHELELEALGLDQCLCRVEESVDLGEPALALGGGGVAHAARRALEAQRHADVLAPGHALQGRQREPAGMTRGLVRPDKSVSLDRSSVRLGLTGPPGGCSGPPHAGGKGGRG
jgi:hypothetical protein